MGILAWIILGGLAGWFASMIAGNNAEQGIVGNIVVGIVGAFVGGFVINLIGGEGVTGFNIYSLVVATIGATLTLFVWKKIRSA